MAEYPVPDRDAGRRGWAADVLRRADDAIGRARELRAQSRLISRRAERAIERTRRDREHEAD